MRNKLNSSRRIFIKQFATSTAGIAIGTNLLGAERNIALPIGNNIPSVNLEPLPKVSWRTLRGDFSISFNLEPAVAATWETVKRERPGGVTGEYRSGAYLLRINEKDLANESCLIDYELVHTGNQSFRMLECRVECKTSYSGIYKIFTPDTMSQQNYQVDLPFRIKGHSNAEINQPVVWMQQTDGGNTLTLGLFNQIAVTNIEGSTYDTGNGGEAPGIANSYVRVSLNQTFPNRPSLSIFKDTLYVNANPKITWFEALKGYGSAIDTARGLKIDPLSKWALNPMWHSWYAHADKIDEKKILDDSRRAKDLGVTTIELDAGWNIPPDVAYSFDSDGDYIFDSARFPNPKGMVEQMHAAGQRVILHVAPLLMGKECKAWTKMKDCKIIVNGVPDAHLDPRLKKVHDYLLTSWENMFTMYDIDGLWYDFLEIPDHADPPASGMEVISDDLHIGYTKLMQALYNKAIAVKPDAVTILRRGSANLNSKTFCTHVWPMDTPQDYNMNRRDVVYMKTFGAGVLTHACCTSWAISESDVNVARQIASMVLAGVPAFSVILAGSPDSHNVIIKAWLAFYEANKEDLVLGQMIPLLPTPPSAALRIESEKQAFFGFFEAVPGLVEVTKPINKITIINAFNKRTATRLEGVKGTWEVQLYDQVWHLLDKTIEKTDAKGGLNINVIGNSACHSVVLVKK